LVWAGVTEMLGIGATLRAVGRGEHENDRSFRLMAAIYDSLQRR
jgi:hypothetical protein